MNTPQNASKSEEQIDRVGLSTEITELVEGTMGVNRLKSYTEVELRYLCRRITKEVGKIHQRLADLAEKHDIEIGKTKHLKRSYRLDFEAKDFEHMRFVEGLRPEIGQMIKSHLICWQVKPIDEVLQYVKYCSDKIELKQKKLKEKTMVMQIKAAQTGVQGTFVQQIPQQQGTVIFQPQMRVDGIEIQTNSDDEEDPAPEVECEIAKEEYPLIEFFPMFTVRELHSDFQGMVQENVWDLTGKEVGLIKGVEPIKVTLKPNALFLQLPQ
ncbi:hypothetical protein NDU88_006466 [Pleurodeles waltl]|uniref:Uncharacterized protein n=1 Tax=Pleurodeles waltl TaxID=8319 RepID=A0AAV7QHQ2_PLEWA|nr:hypothetical protein NDU88_006466 [Pleurodeles waltl]